jgi:hypothetical protein
LKEAKQEQKEVLQLIDHIETKHMFSALNPLNWFRSSNSIDGSQTHPALEPQQPEFAQSSSVTIEEIAPEAITDADGEEHGINDDDGAYTAQSSSEEAHMEADDEENRPRQAKSFAGRLIS